MHKQTGDLVPFEEYSLFVLDGVQVSNRGVAKAKGVAQTGEEGGKAAAKGWLYAVGNVRPVASDVLRAMTKDMKRNQLLELFAALWVVRESDS